MKKNKFRRLIISIFALSMAFGSGFMFTHAKANKEAEIVLAEGEEESETPSEGEEETPVEPGEGEETPAEGSGDEEKPAEEPAEEESKPAESQEVTYQDFLSAIINAFKDAWADLIAHFKRWFSK